MHIPEPLLAAVDAPAPSEGHCANCVATRQGRFCHDCGQVLVTSGSPAWHSRSGVLEAYWLVYDRVLGTLRDLCVPGRVAADYVAGHRVRYVPPLRLFGLLSVLAFFLAQGAISTGDNFAQLKIGRVSLSVSPPDAATGATASVDSSTPVRAPGTLDLWLARQVQRVDDEMLHHGQDPTAALLAIIRTAPSAMLVLMPIFALMLQLAHIGSRWHYLDHLVVVTYSHAFLCMALSITFLLTTLASAWPWFESIAGWAIGLVWLWVPIYLLLTQKRVYGLRWPSTLARHVAIGIAYGVTVTSTTFVFAIIKLLWL